MELDDLKQAVWSLDRRLEQGSTPSLELYKEQKLDRTRASLRPLVWGHAAQVAFGVLLSVVAGSFWWRHSDEPNLMIAGVIVHVYAVLMIALGARVLVHIHTLNLAAPVLAIQKQLARLRRSYVTTGLVVGLPWWCLWIPFVMVISGADLVANTPASWLVLNLLVGIAGILGTLWFYRVLWYRPAHDERRRNVEVSAAGNSLRRAQKFLDEIARFERE
jgi:hypothetical protein